VSRSRKHDWTRGPTWRLGPDARKYIVHYRGRKMNEEGAPWLEGTITMVVKINLTQGEQYDPEGLRALDRRLRSVREKNKVEIEVFSIVDGGDEQALQIGPNSPAGKVVNEKVYDELRASSSIIYPGHPLWRGGLIN